MGQEFDNALAIQALYNKARNETKVNLSPQEFKEVLETKATSSQCEEARDMFSTMAVFGGMAGNPPMITVGLIGAAGYEQAGKVLKAVGK